MNETGRILIPLLGEYSRPRQIRLHAQMFFLDIVSNVTPEPLYSLRDEVLPKYRAAFKFEQKHGQPDAKLQTLAQCTVVDVVRGKGVKLPQAIQRSVNAHPLIYEASAGLIDWSERFNLSGKRSTLESEAEGNASDADFSDEYWAIVAALDTLLFWHFHPHGRRWERRDPPLWRPPAIKLNPLVAQLGAPPCIHADGWQIELETALAFRRRMNSLLEQYMADRVRSALTLGLVKTPSKRALTLHFTWAAEYQIGGRSPAKIARAHKVKSTDTIEDGIQTALELIHLEKRPPLRGGTKGTHHQTWK